MPDLPDRALVVSLHDVSPRTHGACARIVEELAAAGVRRMSLLVIPDHHRRGRVLDDESFLGWLREKARDGHEIVTHGYHHQRARRPGETTMQRLVTRIYTAGEGEFYDLDRATARELAGRGEAELRQAGFDPHGFIAPAWLLGGEAREALRDLGIAYTTTLGTVADLANGREWRSQALVWSVRGAWRRALSLAWNAALFARMRGAPLMRIAIHPVDRNHPVVWRQARALIARALAGREPMTYHAWLTTARRREAAHPAAAAAAIPREEKLPWRSSTGATRKS